MDGLEATEIRLKQLNAEFRVDAEYHQKTYLREDKARSKYENRPLGALAFITDGQHGYHEVDEGSPIALLTAKNAKNWFANRDGADKIAKWVDDNNRRSSLQAEDIIVSTRGTVGYCALVTSEVLPANIDQDVARVAVESNAVSTEFLLGYLNCTVGQDWLKRNTTGMVQQGVALGKLRELPVPILSVKFQEETKRTIGLARQKSERSKLLYANAEHLLLQTVGFKQWEPPKHSLAFKSFLKSFGTFGRIDAEYYHPEKQQILDWLAALRGKSIGEYFTPIYDVLNPIAANPNELVSNYDLDDALPFYLKEKDSTPVYEIGSTKKRFKRGDVLISRLRSYLKEIAIVDLSESENCVGSSEFIVLRPKGRSITPQLLLVYLRSLPVQRILKWCQSGSNHPRFMEHDLLSIKLPDKLLTAQEKIQEAVRKAITVGRESERLLDIAKRAVEIAIEHDEVGAIEFIATQFKANA